VPAQKKWLATIGLEFTSGNDPSAFGNVLLASGVVQVLYTVRDPNFRLEELKEHEAVSWIRNRWNPWTNQVQMLSWTAGKNGEVYPSVREASLGSPLSILSILHFPVRRPRLGPGGSQGENNPQASQQSSVEFSAAKPGTSTDRGTVVEETAPLAAAPVSIDQVTPSVGSTPDAGRSSTPVKRLQDAIEAPCSSPTLTRCGDQCVDVKTNPFHYESCFQIAPSLSQSAAERVDSPPAWSDEAIQTRHYYRLFYAWNDKNSAVVVHSLPSRSGWDRGTVTGSIQLTLGPDEIARVGYNMLVVTDLEVHCSGQAWVAGFASTAREMYEKLSTQSTWRSFPKQPWRGPGETSTNTELVRTLRPVLSTWEKLCSRQR